MKIWNARLKLIIKLQLNIAGSSRTGQAARARKLRGWVSIFDLWFLVFGFLSIFGSWSLISYWSLIALNRCLLIVYCDLVCSPALDIYKLIVICNFWSLNLECSDLIIADCLSVIFDPPYHHFSPYSLTTPSSVDGPARDVRF